MTLALRLLFMIALWCALPQSLSAAPMDLLDQGDKLEQAGDLKGAVTLYRQALDEAQAAGGPDSVEVRSARIYLISALTNLNELAEAEHLVRKNLDSVARVLGEQNVEYAAGLLQWGSILVTRSEEAKAVPLFRRSLAIFSTLPDVSPSTIENVKLSLASALSTLHKTDEAEKLLQGLDAASGRTGLLAMANARAQADDYEGAERLYALALKTVEETDGRSSYAAAIPLSGLAAALLGQQKDLDRAQAMAQEAVGLIEARLGPHHADLTGSLDLLVSLAFLRKDYDTALKASRRSTDIVENWAANYSGKTQQSALSLDGSQQFQYRMQAFCAWQIAQQQPERFDEMLDVAYDTFQRSANPQAAQALMRMAERRAASDPDFAKLMRRFQDLSQKVTAEQARAVDMAGEDKGGRVFAGITLTEVELAKVKAQIAQRFAAAGKPADSLLPRAEAATLLKPGELLVLLSEGFGAAGTGNAIAISSESAWWIGLDTMALRDAGSRLRATLGATGNARGVIAAPSDDGEASPAGGFDFAAAQEVYDLAFAPFKDALANTNHIIVVTSPGLFDIPFEAALAKAPDDAASATALRDAHWLIRDSAISLLPSVASLKALRGLPPESVSQRPMAGFADPSFSGPEQVLPALPETASEVQHMAASITAPGNLLLLGAQATEAAVKAADLSGYGLLAFATHGLKAGELEGLAEPALALTPGGGEDGLLTASEVANLTLDAGWVILSACNTASGESAGAEGFSGLARAFFYAGARSLLVSHWPVYSDAAVKLTTGALAAEAQSPATGRAEALRQSMLAILDKDPNQAHWHPSYWAPFVLLGDGG